MQQAGTGVGADGTGLEFRPGQSTAVTWGKGQAASDKVIQVIAVLLEGASTPSHTEKVGRSGWQEEKGVIRIRMTTATCCIQHWPRCPVCVLWVCPRDLTNDTSSTV